MKKTNLDKFIEIESIMVQAEEEMDKYLQKLKERYHYMNVLRKEYSNFLRALERIQHRLEQKISMFEADEDVKVVKASAIDQIKYHIESLEEDNDYKEHDVVIKQLKDVKVSLEEKMDADNLGKIWKILKVRNINIEEINVLLDLMDMYEGDNITDIEENFIKRILNIRSEYISNFVTFRTACIVGDGIERELQRLIDDLADAGFNKEGDILTGAKPDTREERGKRPDPEPLLNLLMPIKRSGLAYFQSRNRKSESYDLNVAFAKEIAYTRRALLEDREYIGTRNAFERVKTAFENLSAYMYVRFHQLDKSSNNYHRYEDRKQRKTP